MVFHLQSRLSSNCANIYSPFCSGYFGDGRGGVSWTLCLGWPKTMILLILASQVARITDLSHQCLAYSLNFCGVISVYVKWRYKRTYKHGRVAQVVEHLPSKYEALSSTPPWYRGKKKKDRMYYTPCIRKKIKIYVVTGSLWLMPIILATWEGEIGRTVGLGQPWQIVHLSSRAPAMQVWSSEFKTQSHKKGTLVMYHILTLLPSRMLCTYKGGPIILYCLVIL
jgi:hypothetical protein